MINSLSSGGAERFILDLCNEFASKGHEVMLIMTEQPNGRNAFYLPELDKKVRFESLGNNNFMTVGQAIKSIRKYKQLERDFKPDVVHTHIGADLQIITSLNKKHPHYFYTIHNLAPLFAHTWWKKKLNHYTYSRDLITPVTISNECQASYMDFYSLPRPARINNGRSKVVKSPDFNNVIAEIESYKKSKETKVFVNVARCNDCKNHRLMVKTFNDLHKEGYDVQLLIIGNGFFDSELGSELREMAGPNIHFLGEKSNIGDYLYASHFFTLSSNVEGLPISLLEALSAGTTPICTPAGGVVNVIKDKETGFLAKEISYEAYKASILDALSTPLPKDKLITYWEDNFSMRKCAEEHLNLFQSKLSSEK